MRLIQMVQTARRGTILRDHAMYTRLTYHDSTPLHLRYTLRTHCVSHREGCAHLGHALELLVVHGSLQLLPELLHKRS